MNKTFYVTQITMEEVRNAMIKKLDTLQSADDIDRYLDSLSAPYKIELDYEVTKRYFTAQYLSNRAYKLLGKGRGHEASLEELLAEYKEMMRTSYLQYVKDGGCPRWSPEDECQDFSQRPTDPETLKQDLEHVDLKYHFYVSY